MVLASLGSIQAPHNRGHSRAGELFSKEVAERENNNKKKKKAAEGGRKEWKGQEGKDRPSRDALVFCPKISQKGRGLVD